MINTTSKVLMLAVAILLTFSATKYLPGFFLLSEVWTAFCLALTLYVVLASKFKFTRFERYVLLMVVYIIAVSAWAANSAFGQPFVYGLLCMRQYLISGFTIYYLWLVRKRTLELRQVELSFIALGWFFLIANTLAKILLDPAQFEASAGFIAEGSDKFILDASFIVFMFLYYSISALVRSKLKHGVYASAFFIYYLIFDGGRFALLSMIVALTVVIFWYGRGALVAAALSKGAVAIFGLFFLASLLFSEKMDSLMGKYSEAFVVLATGQEGSDSSANSRLLQFDIAAPYIERNPFFGNGMLSSQWNDGFLGMFGYFHPSDNGFVGVVFVFGIVGLVLLLAQFAFAIFVSKKLSAYKVSSVSNAFLLAVKCYLVYVFTFSFTSGKLAFGFECSVFLVGILYSVLFVEKRRSRSQVN